MNHTVQIKKIKKQLNPQPFIFSSKPSEKQVGAVRMMKDLQVKIYVCIRTDGFITEL